MGIYSVADIVVKPPGESDSVAVVHEARRVTYRELAARADALASGLEAAGFAQGDRICVLMHNRVEWLEVFFAVARLGGVVVPVNHLLTPHEMRYLVEGSDAGWLLAEASLWEKVEGVRGPLERTIACIAVDGAQAGAREYDALFAAGRPLAPRDLGIDDRLLLQYTSGTTGFPKGAIHTHSTVMWNAISQREHFSVDASTVYLCLPAMSWVAGLHSLLMATLWAGGTVVVNPTSAPFDAGAFCETAEAHRVTHVALVPTVMRRILELPDLEGRNLSSLRIAITGGESVPVHLMRRMNERLPDVAVIQVYGMSEFPSLATLLAPEDYAHKVGSAGKPNCVSQVRVVDAEDRDCAPGDVGEIVIRSPASMLGYHRQPEATAAALRGGWFHTGDLGRLDEDGFLFISGRSKDLIISGGLNIYPAEVEHALERHPAVAEAAVVGRADSEWGEIPKAVVVLRPDSTVSEDELRAHLEPLVARFKIPKQWDIRTGPPLPRTASGKLQKYRLVERQDG